MGGGIFLGGPQSSSYIVQALGDVVTAYPMSGTGLESFEGDTHTVIQGCIDAVAEVGGGTILLLKARYPALSEGLLINNRHIRISAEIGTILQGSVMPLLEVLGNGMDLPKEDEVINDVQVLGFPEFLYTGSVQTGKVVNIHGGISSDNRFQGPIIFNLITRYCPSGTDQNTQMDVPTDETFVGFNLEDCVGAHICFSTDFFGTGYRYGGGGIWQGSHNVYTQCMIGYCKRGVWYNWADTTCETWIALKIMHTAEYAFYGDSDGYPTQLIMIAPQVEIAFLNGYNLRPSTLQITNGVFSSIYDNPAIVFQDSSTGADSSAWLQQNSFWNCPAGAIKTASPTFLWGNQYSGTTPAAPVILNGAYGKIIPASFDLGYVIVNAGNSIGTGAQQTIAHGLSAIPTAVYFSDIDLEAGPYQSAVADAANIYITAVSGKNYRWKAVIE